MKKFKGLFVLFFFLVYYEVIFKLFLNYKIFTLENFLNLFYLVFISVLIFMLLNLFKSKKHRKIILVVFLFFNSFWFGMQISLYKLMGFFYTFNLMSSTAQVFTFQKEILSLIYTNAVAITFLFIPPFITIFKRKDENKNIFKQDDYLVLSIILIISLNIFFLGLFYKNKGDYSRFDLFFKYNDVNLNVKDLGVKVSLHLDIIKYLNNFEEKISITKKEANQSSKKEYSFLENKLNYSFKTNFKDVDLFFENEAPTFKNKYTGLFEGKNLVLILAESFNEIAVSKELTPTLYKLINDGFVFKNYYTPTINSTIGGEFQLLTSLIPANGYNYAFRNEKINYPFKIGEEFKKLNYKVNAYHNHLYAFQERHFYLKQMGFTDYLACGNGLESRIKCIDVGHTSDIELFKATTSDYINEENFFAYYITVSGHAIENTYSFRNMVSRKYKKETSTLNASEAVRAYVATQIELDRALEHLIKDLEKAGKLADTVIALTADHRPYAFSTNEMNELSKTKKDSVIEVDRSNLIIWNLEVEKTNIYKTSSTIDVLPTLYNLFNIKYDSRILLGKDILSEGEGLAIFGDRSWVSDSGRYYSRDKKFVLNENKTVDLDYVTNTLKYVDNKIAISSKVMINNYYKFLEVK